MALVDVAYSAEEAKRETTLGEEAEEGGPKYPWGLSISLDDETLAKLGITQMPDIGTAMTLTARVEVCSTSQYANQKSTDKSVSLQITAMELSGAAESSPSTASLLYPAS
jgi:hypothetical protein